MLKKLVKNCDFFKSIKTQLQLHSLDTWLVQNWWGSYICIVVNSRNSQVVHSVREKPIVIDVIVIEKKISIKEEKKRIQTTRIKGAIVRYLGHWALNPDVTSLFSTRVFSTSMRMYWNDNTSVQQAGKYEDSISTRSAFKQDTTSSVLLLDILFKVHLKKQPLWHSVDTGCTKTRNLHLYCCKIQETLKWYIAGEKKIHCVIICNFPSALKKSLNRCPDTAVLLLSSPFTLSYFSKTEQSLSCFSPWLQSPTSDLLLLLLAQKEHTASRAYCCLSQSSSSPLTQPVTRFCHCFGMHHSTGNSVIQAVTYMSFYFRWTLNAGAIFLHISGLVLCYYITSISQTDVIK